MRKQTYSEVDYQNQSGMTHLADINKELFIKITKLHSEVNRMKEENSKIREDCRIEAIQHYRF